MKAIFSLKKAIVAILIATAIGIAVGGTLGNGRLDGRATALSTSGAVVQLAEKGSDGQESHG